MVVIIMQRVTMDASPLFRLRTGFVHIMRRVPTYVGEHVSGTN